MPQDPSAWTKVPPRVHAAAKAQLPAGWTLSGYLSACLHALAHRPTEMLALVAPYREDRRRGRPRKPRPAPKP